MDTYEFVQKQMKSADHLEYAVYYRGYYLCLITRIGLETWRVQKDLGSDKWSTKDTFANRESAKIFVNNLIKEESSHD